MTVMTTAQVAAGTRMSIAEWLALPEDDGCLVELFEGVIVLTMNPPVRRHTRLVTELAFLLRQGVPRDMTVLVGPFGVLVPTRNSALEPDLAVVPTAERDEMDATPWLVAEVLSPSTRGRDQVDKRRLYAARGILSYWLLDPQVPDLRVLELGDSGEYVEITYVSAGEAVDLMRPFAVRVCPAELLA